MHNNFTKIFPKRNILIGMIHLLASPGYPEHQGFQKTLDYALDDLHALQRAGFDAVLVENDNDQPHMITPTPEVISFMTLITSEIVKRAEIPVGVEVLLNDPLASMGIAANTGCKFIRTDYFVDRMSRDIYGGEMKIQPEEIVAYRKKLQAEEILILADLQVKYATLLEKGKSIGTSLKQAIEKEADAVVITGNFTGEKPKLDDLITARNESQDFPILVGSGFASDNAKQLLEYANGAIIGSSIKIEGFNSPVSLEKARTLVEIAKS